MIDVCFEPVGYVRTQFAGKKVKNSLTGVEGYIEILKNYSEDTRGLEGYSHILVIA